MGVRDTDRTGDRIRHRETGAREKCKTDGEGEAETQRNGGGEKCKGKAERDVHRRWVKTKNEKELQTAPGTGKGRGWARA